jgi:SpoVK/Ycf46/Vps4 family AAA+-type ATPase
VINLNLNQDTHSSLESNVVRKIVLDSMMNDINSKGFSIQISDSILIQNINNTQLLRKLSILGKIYSPKHNSIIIIGDQYCINVYVNNRTSYKVVMYSIYGNTIDDVENIKNRLCDTLNSIKKELFDVTIRWYFSSGDGVDYGIISEIIEDTLYKEAYPFINDFDQFINDYINGNEQVIIFIGPPGTGKTRLIRHIVKKIFENIKNKEKEALIEDDSNTSFLSPYEEDEYNVSYTCDIKVLEKDNIFIDFLSDNIAALVLEDIDTKLGSRKEGNNMMHRLLSASDGFISNLDRKIIVSTNLETSEQIDEALVRPGRCYSIVKTRKLDKDESYTLLNLLSKDKDIELINESYTLAELYRLSKGIKERKIDNIRKVGF